ncbi:hypothetical protein B9G55_08830 [Saccharibacillus sp. O16]|nr:hypothetical protein B9G55_08830 [Saccharibacillus sp. O16]
MPLLSRKSHAWKGRFSIPGLLAAGLSLGLLLSGCGSEAEETGLPKEFGGKHQPTSYSEQAREKHASEEIAGWSSKGEPFYILSEEASYGPNSKISMILVNKSQEPLYHGLDYEIEKKTGKSWSKVPFGQAVGIDSVGLRVLPDNVDWQAIQLENFPAGVYRYVKTVELEKSQQKKTLYREFTIKSDGA